MVDAILGHVAVGGPLAAGDGEQAGGVDVDDMVARESGGFAVALDERAQAYVDGEHIGAGGRTNEEARGSVENELDLFFERARFEAWRVDGRIGGSGNGVAMPGNDKEHPAVACFGNHESSIALQERALENQVNALAGDHERLGGGVGHVADGVGEDAGSVDDDAGVDQ